MLKQITKTPVKIRWPMSQGQRQFSFYSSDNYNPEFKKQIQRQGTIRSDKEYRFAIVGSGPAGFYMAKMMLASIEKCRVDIFDRNPHPYGLIRTGVAPDHQAMKKIMKDFKQVFDQNQGRVQFFGNVWLGDIDEKAVDYEFSKEHMGADGSQSINIQQLRDRYSAVILAHGALKDRHLGLEHELTADGILPSRRVVNWYNGSLDDDLDVDREFNLRDSKNITVIGNGNIFCDISRTLMKDPEELAKTDMPSRVADLLRNSNLQNIQAVARRGITQAAFTTKEIREISMIPGLELYMMRDEVQRSMTPASDAELHSNYARAVGRRTEFLLQNFRAIQNDEHYQEVLENGKKKLILRFLLSPEEFVVDSANKVQAMKFSNHKLIGAMNEQKAVPDEELTDLVTIESDIVIKSIGYKTLPIAGVPFDHRKHTVPHEFGCVIDPENNNATIPGLYVAGWAKRGPVGIIDATLRDSKETFSIIKHHCESNQLEEKKTTVEEVQAILPENHVSYSKWLGVDQIEVERGQPLNKIREKILDRNEMLNLTSL